MRHLMNNNGQQRHGGMLGLLLAVVLLVCTVWGSAMADTQRTNDLNLLLDSASIYLDGKFFHLNGTVDGDIYAGKDYVVQVTFREDSDIQFNDDNLSYEYHFPDGFIPKTVTNERMSILVSGGGNQYTIYARINILEDNGKWILRVSIDKDDEGNTQEKIDALAMAPNEQFFVNVGGSFSEGVNKYGWSAGIESTINVQPERHEVTVEKTGSFSPSAKQMNYTVTVRSEGSNNKVVVTDEVTGTALKYRKDVYSVPADKGTADHHDNGFTYTITAMEDGEVVVLQYSADIDSSVITDAKGTAEQTGNTIKVKSDQDTKGEEKTIDNHGQIDFGSQVTKEAGLVTENGSGLKVIPWTITVNSQMLQSMAGKTVTDTIAEDSKAYMKYDGDISVTVRDSNGIHRDTAVITPDSKTDDSWSYTIPATDDGKYSYTFTYNTVVDTSTWLKDDSVKNSFSDGADHSANREVSIPIDENEKIGVTKKAVKQVGSTITWEVNLTVPAKGLTSAVVTDTQRGYPPVDGKIMYDTVVEDDVQISGLVEGESYKFSSNGDSFTITFEKEEGVDGLKATSDTRLVTVRYVAHVSNDRLNYDIENILTDSNAGLHRNDVNFKANGITVGVSDETTLIPQSITKVMEASGIADDGMPYYTYKLVITGLEGALDITDSFDTRYLSLVTPVAGEEWKFTDGGSYKLWYLYGQMNMYGHGAGEEATVNETDTGLTIHMDADKVPTMPNGERYGLYVIKYKLKIIDANALQALKQAAAANATKPGEYILHNTAESMGKSCDADVIYEYPVLKKEEESRNDGRNGRASVSFKITINPAGVDLVPNSDILTLTDDLSDALTLDYTSVVVNPAEGSTVSTSGNQMTITFPDSQATTVTYRAFVNGNGPVEYSNTAVLSPSFADGLNNTIDVHYNGEGGGSFISVKVYKCDNDDKMKKLSGAKFQLHEKKNGKTYTLVDKDSKTPVVFVTGTDGVVTIECNASQHLFLCEDDEHIGSLNYGGDYELSEIEAPEGYQKLLIPYAFKIAAQGQAPDYANNVYLDNDIINVTNSKDTTSKFPVKINKYDSNGTTELSDAVLVIKQGGTTVKGPWTSDVNSDWEIDLEPGTYTLEETTAPAGYNTITTAIEFTVNANGTVTVTNDNTRTDVDLTNGVIKVKNTLKTVDIKVIKQWIGDTSNLNTTNLPTLTLHRKCGSVDAAVMDSEKHVPAPNATPNYVEWTNLPAEYINNGVKVGDWLYYVQESSLAGYTTTYSTNNTTGVNGGDITVTNTKNAPATVSITVTKRWVGGAPNLQTMPMLTLHRKNSDGSVNVIVPETEAEVKSVPATDGASVSWSNLPAKDADGNDWLYYVEESSLAGYTTTYSTNNTTGVNGGDITVTNTKNAPATVSITVTKRWVGGAPNLQTMPMLTLHRKNSDGSVNVIVPKTEAEAKAVPATDGASVSWSNLPAKDADGNDWLYYVVEDVLDNYNTTYSSTGIAGNGTITVTNTKKGTVKINKYDITGTKELKDAALEIWQGTNLIDRWFSKENEIWEETLNPGDYSIVETTPPIGYSRITAPIEFNVSTDGVVTLKNTANRTDVDIVNGEIRIKDTRLVDVAVTKQWDDPTPTVMPKFVLWRQNGNVDQEVPGVIEQDVPSSGSVYWYGLEAERVENGQKIGDWQYYVKESDTPGYVVTYTDNGSETGVIRIKATNAMTSVQISKVDLDTGDEVEGATIQIIDSEGHVVEEWKSTTEPHEVKGLKTGEKYTLCETVAPDGYAVTEETTFVLNADGTINTTNTTAAVENGTLLVKDEKTSISISKVDLVSGDELEGAHIQVIDKDGKVIEEWDSTEEAHEVTGLKTGETYTLRETVAPDGYAITTDTTFVLKSDGKIDEEKTKTTISDDGVLLVKDSMTSVKISKVDIANGKELEGATIQILDKDGKEVETWTSGKEPHEVKGLKTGEEYTLCETVAPNGYAITTDTTFILNDDGTIDTENTTTTISDDGVLLVEDGYAEQLVYISKQTVGGKELAGAELTITGREIGAAEDREPITWTSDTSTHVVKLKPGTYRLHENAAPAGYLVANDITFTLTLEEGKAVVRVNGKVVDANTIIMIDEVKPEKPDKPDEPYYPTTPKFTVKKVWKDDGVDRPASITIEVTDGNDAGYSRKYVLNSGNNWKVKFTKENGRSYQVKEIYVPGYITSYSQSGNTITIINTKVPVTGDKNLIGIMSALLLLSASAIFVLGKQKR